MHTNFKNQIFKVSVTKVRTKKGILSKQKFTTNMIDQRDLLYIMCSYK